MSDPARQARKRVQEYHGFIVPVSAIIVFAVGRTRLFADACSGGRYAERVISIPPN